MRSSDPRREVPGTSRVDFRGSMGRYPSRGLGTLNATTMGSESSSRRRVIGIGGIFLRSKEPKRLARWYREHLGLEVENQVVTFEWLSPRPGHRLGATVWAALPSNDRDWGRNHPTAMVNYRVENLDHVLAELKKEGVEVEGKTEESEYGRFGWVMDPDGNRVELWEPPRTAYRSSERHVEME